LLCIGQHERLSRRNAQLAVSLAATKLELQALAWLAVLPNNQLSKDRDRTTPSSCRAES